MQFGSPRGGERIYVKDGVMKNGRIIARKVRAYFDSGAYTRLSSYAVVKCAAHIPGPYTIPNVHGDIFCVFTNRTPATAMRGFGVTALDFALECQMDRGATAVGMDPIEYRILNAYRDGDMKAHRREAKNCALIECAQVAAEKANWPLRDEFRKMSSRQGGGAAAHAGAAADRSRAPASAAPVRAPATTPTSTPQRVAYERPAPSAPPPRPAPPAPPPRNAPPPPAAPAGSTHGAPRFSSVFGTRRR
jgi:CO/xanthine dehydrogenase Mo-binding subunit